MPAISISTPFLLSAIGIASGVYAQVTPTTPGPNETYYAGSNCTIAWNVDTTGSWTNMTIDLMSGSNSNVTFVDNVALGLDGTDASLTPYDWTCPDVDPYSAIYFYEVTNNGNVSTAEWTTRFTIASTSGDSSPPAYSKQPNGDEIPWGIGQLVIDINSDPQASKSTNASASSPNGSESAGSPSQTDSSSANVGSNDKDRTKSKDRHDHSQTGASDTSDSDANSTQTPSATASANSSVSGSSDQNDGDDNTSYPANASAASQGTTDTEDAGKTLPELSLPTNMVNLPTATPTPSTASMPQNPSSTFEDAGSRNSIGSLLLPTSGKPGEPAMLI